MYQADNGFLRPTNGSVTQASDMCRSFCRGHHMRDFRDAKSMAQTLRELLKAKSVSLTHSESLELMAKILGVQDWNVLSATIEAAVVKRNKAASTPLLSGGSDQEVLVAAKILDGYVGFFQLSDRAIYKVTRDGGH